MSDDKPPRLTQCAECGEELWSATESNGLCIGCQARDSESEDAEDAEEE